jgi:hypothetical protein
MRIAGIVLMIIILAACENLPEPLTTTGVITGSTYADSAGKATSYGVMIKASGPYGTLSIVTKDEYYRIEGVGNGTYDLEFSKKGYGTVHQYGIQVFGDETRSAATVVLYDLPTLTSLPKFIKAYTQPSQYPSYTTVNIDLAVTPLSKSGLPVLLFMSNSMDVAWNKYEFCYPGTMVASKNSIPYIYFTQQLPFKSKSEVFIRGYVCNPREYNRGGYLDTYRGVYVYSTLNKDVFSQVVSFIMP